VPSIAATKTDALLSDNDADGNGGASPGDTLRYTVMRAFGNSRAAPGDQSPG